LNPLDRHRGCLLGLATGDALGTTLEFQRPGSFEPIHAIGSLGSEQHGESVTFGWACHVVSGSAYEMSRSSRISDSRPGTMSTQKLYGTLEGDAK